MNATPTTPFRDWRLSTRDEKGMALSLREIARRTEIPPWRLSLIERGMPPTDDERAALIRVLTAASGMG